MKNKIILFIAFPCLMVPLLIAGYNQTKLSEETKNGQEKYSVRMAQSEMQRFPEAWMSRDAKEAKWDYCIGVLTKAMLDMWEYTGKQEYFDYAEAYADKMILADGTISNYNFNDFNIDNINPGKNLFVLFEETGKQKYKIALDTLRKQMTEHPRTSEGGFWHKKKYPWQMWVDGLYMGAPFLAQYAKEYNEPKLFDVVSRQVILMDKHCYDSTTGLYYHAWDESREQRWADPVTGNSPHFWGRGLGWFGTALVDILDFLPENHKDRDQIIEILNKTAKGIVRYQDKESGVWYQVLDQGSRAGNYLESTASSMFVNFLFKAVRKGYLEESYLDAANIGYAGIINTFIKENDDGSISLTNCCAGAGLGGNPYRDGSFEYYINEKIIDNDPKGTGPFIWASIEHETINKTGKVNNH